MANNDTWQTKSRIILTMNHNLHSFGCRPNEDTETVSTQDGFCRCKVSEIDHPAEQQLPFYSPLWTSIYVGLSLERPLEKENTFRYI